MKRLYFFLAAAVLSTIPVWADDLKPELLGQEVREYNALSTGDVDPGNHEIWKLYICGELYSTNYNHEKETFLAKLVPNSPYIVYLRINQLYNFLQPIPKVGDVLAVEGHVVSHFYSTITGPTKIKRIPVLYFYIENAKMLPFEPAEAAVILNSEPKSTPTAGSSSAPMAAASAPGSQTAAAPVVATPGFFKADPTAPAH